MNPEAWFPPRPPHSPPRTRTCFDSIDNMRRKVLIQIIKIILITSAAERRTSISNPSSFCLLLVLCCSLSTNFTYSTIQDPAQVHATRHRTFFLFVINYIPIHYLYQWHSLAFLFLSPPQLQPVKKKTKERTRMSPTHLRVLQTAVKARVLRNFLPRSL